MSPNIFYKESKIAKNGSTVPVLANGKSFFSEYNPERDIQFYAAAPSVKDSGFILVGGLGDGNHIHALLSANPAAYIMVLEYNKETLDYLFESGICDREIKNNPRVSFSTAEDLCTSLKNTYIPVIHGTFLFHPIKAWLLAYEELACQAYGGGLSIKDVIQSTIKDIAADYATQARFGKLMHTNILKNLKLLSHAGTHCEQKDCAGKLVSESEIRNLAANNTEKEAAVIGAGPSLDETMPLLKQNRDRFYVIATDTAYRTLYRNGIIADMAVTLDGQNASLSHFLGIVSPETVLAADICANAAAARYLYEQGCRMFFFTTGHPLGTLVNRWYSTQQETEKAQDKGAVLSETSRTLLPVYTAGCGTVLSAAADIAVKAGFKKVRFFGADFAYKSGKPYTRGTYLDDTFFKAAYRINPQENSFCSLCYRTELTPSENGYTTPLLASYKDNLLSYIKLQNTSFDFIKSDSTILDQFQNNHVNNDTNLHDLKVSEYQDKECAHFAFEKFLSFFITALKNQDSAMLYSILPFATWLKEKKKNADIKDIFTKAAELSALIRS